MIGNFFWLISFFKHYRIPLTIGLILAFFVSILNGISLTLFIPLFDALGSKSQEFYFPISEKERNLLEKTIRIYHDENNSKTFTNQNEKDAISKGTLLSNVKKIDKELSKEYLYYLNKLSDHHWSKFTPIEIIQLQLIVRTKLNINMMGFSALKIVILSSILIFILYILKLLLHLLSIRFIAGSGYKVIRDIRKIIYQKLHELPLHYFYKEKSGILLSRLVNDIEFLTPIISSNIRDTITNIFYLITHLFLLIYLNYKFFLISILSFPFILFPMMLVLKKIGKSTERSQNLLAELSSIMQEFINGIKTIRYFSLEDRVLEQLKQKNHRFTWRSFKEIYYLKMGPNIIELTSTLYTLFLIGLGIYYIDHQNFTTGEFFAFLLTTLFIIRPIIQFSSMIGKLQQASTIIQRIKEFLSILPEIKDPLNPKIKKPLKHYIRFENVSFQYPGTEQKVLENINFEVKVGQTVAIVGESGSGKSTLMDLLARFFDPTEGRILFDGIDIREFRIKDHRSRFGIVQQDTFLFYGTIKENIAYGSPNFSLKEIEKSARLAYVHDFIQSLPEGYDTVIGERGINLSGGQKQRIAIARAIYYNPEILIFDEATSALDPKSERLFQRALERLFKNRTTFIIAHRLSTIEKADVIIVLNKGKIIDMGTHEDLMNKTGLYSKLQEISREILVTSEIRKEN
ncbi:MAG: ABC transporter ATP-binding protein/permease [Leptospiraceae bacterium]|nr:ABC transporter ATP-binding protein/permease [Leptospiraceae bacterium]MDW7975816.1 ABC transporter ATP-binding protein [Leptospiraceae bacterium]